MAFPTDGKRRSLTQREVDLYPELLVKSDKSQGGLGAIVFAVLEGLEQGGASEKDLKLVSELCGQHFSKLTNDQCNTLCRVVETRLNQDKVSETVWYP